MASGACPLYFTRPGRQLRYSLRDNWRKYALFAQRARSARESDVLFRLLAPNPRAAADVNGLKLVAAHVPNASNHGPLRKMRVLRYLALQRGDPIIVAGDLNCPKVELSDGTIVGWGRPEQRSLEENLFKWFYDAFRQLNGYGREEWSWIARNGQWRRFDHVLYRGLQPTFAEYLDHEALSDHRALEVHFAMRETRS